MHTTFLGWLAVISLIALPCTHPIRATAFGPRLIAILAFIGLSSFGLYIASNTVDLYLIGEAPILARSGGTVRIATYPALAYFFILLHAALSLACVWAGVWFLRIAMKRKKRDLPSKSKK